MNTEQLVVFAFAFGFRSVAEPLRRSIRPARLIRAAAALPILALLSTGVHAQSSTSTLTIVGPPTVDANGVQYYDVESVYQGLQDQTIRVLQPTNPAPGMPPRLLFVLPVDQGVDTLGSTWSDGLEELRLLDVQDRFNLTLIAPSFNYNPWYGDNVTDPTLRMESFVIDDLVPFADAFAQSSVPQRYLIGFSKSGNGVLDLILRHPSVFNAGAAWDSPAQQSSLSASSDLPENFGTQANYNTYYIPGLVTSNAASFTQQNRLWISGDQADWTADMDALNTQLNNAGIPHTWVAGPTRAHSWGSGWLDGAVIDLNANATLTAPFVTAMAPARTGGLPESLPSGTTQATLSLRTDQNATCRYATTAGIAYNSMANSFSVAGGTAHSAVVSALQDGSQTFYVRCQDTASGLVNTDDYAIAFSIAGSGGGNGGATTTPSVTVTPNPSSITTAQPMQVTVTVSGGNGNPTPTGSVTLNGGGYTSSFTTLSAGSAIVNVPAASLAVGSDTLVATYIPDASGSSTYTNATGSAPVTVTQATGCTTANPNPNPNPAAFAVTDDFNGDCKSDLLWQNTSTGQYAGWLMNGTSVLSTGIIATVGSPWSIVGVGDFDGDGKSDLLWQNSTTGQIAVWLMNGTAVSSSVTIGSVSAPWSLVGVGDFNGDGKSDILWQNTSTGQIAIWLMNGTTVASSGIVGTVGSPWAIVGIGDFNGDGKADLLWQNGTTGQTAIWLMNGTVVSSSGNVATVASPWGIVGVADFNGDGKSDLLWQNSTTGQVAIWLMNGTAVSSSGVVATVGSPWSIQGVRDFNGDGKADLLWRNSTTGQTAIWLMNGTVQASSGNVGTVTSPWQIVTVTQ